MIKFYIIPKVYDDMYGVFVDGVCYNDNCELVSHVEECDYIVFFLFNLDSPDFIKELLYKYNNLNKNIIVIDGVDTNIWVSVFEKIIDVPFLYFKRTIVNKDKLNFINSTINFKSISYGILQKYLQYNIDANQKRDIDICCFPGRKQKVWNTYRFKIGKLLKSTFSNENIFVGWFNNETFSRQNINERYYKTLLNSKIVVTCNPDNWEGDMRLWESLSSGALVFSDKMLTPIINPLIHKKHLIYYNRDNMPELITLLNYYLENEEERKTIAYEGMQFAKQYHNSSAKIDEIISYLHE